MPEYTRLQSINSHLQTPSGLALDAYENLYVTDSTNNKLVIYKNDGSYLDSINGLDEPVSVAVGNGKIYIGNNGNGKVNIYDLNRNFLSDISGFSKPGSITLDASGKVYIVDSEKDVVKVYNDDGTLAFSFGGSGNANGKFHFPTAIAINKSAGEIIVSDLQVVSTWQGTYEGARVQVFDMNGTYKRSFGNYGIGTDKIFRPSGVAVDEEGRAYVTDVFQNVVQVYDVNGAHLGAIFDQAHPMRTPVDIIISDTNKLFIASFYTYTVEVYRITDNKSAYSTVIPKAHSYGNVYVGSASAVQEFTVYNIGNGGLDLGQAVISGESASEFSIVADSCSGGSLAPADTCQILVVMNPSSETSKVADLLIPSNDPASPLTVTLSGTGVAAPNRAPVANAGGPYNVGEGMTSLLDASGSYDIDGFIVTYSWDLDNDGIYETIGNPLGFNASAIDGPQGPFLIGLKVTDNLGATGTATTSISVTNTPPAADAGGPYTGVTETAISLSGSATDPGASDVLTYQWDIDGNGSYETSGKDVQVTFSTEGNYTVGIRVTDDDGGIGIDTATISVTKLVVEIPGVDISLKAGWNLIGWISDTGYYKGATVPASSEYASGAQMTQVASLDAAMAEIGLSSAEYMLVVGPNGSVHIPGSPFNTLKKLLPDKVNGKGKIYYPGFPYNNLTSMIQGQGYFVHMTNNGVLTYDCP
ncbi:MAG: choice-of-anchor D domain-containing protein [Nitrospirae bacterium]|nr:choice-of-anchor D domain-containing protein [Nitrospirota bacterium]